MVGAGGEAKQTTVALPSLPQQQLTKDGERRRAVWLVGRKFELVGRKFKWVGRWWLGGWGGGEVSGPKAVMADGS
jgi:hypothetical protein